MKLKPRLQALGSLFGVLSCEDLRVMVRGFTFRGFPIVDGERFAAWFTEGLRCV